MKFISRLLLCCLLQASSTGLALADTHTYSNHQECVNACLTLTHYGFFCAGCNGATMTYYSN